MENMHQQNQSSPNKVANSPVDFNIDDFDFKPITPGLGFHHDKSINKPAKKISVASGPVVKKEFHKKEVNSSFKANNDALGDLAAFYGKTESEKPLINTEVEPVLMRESFTVLPVSLTKRVLAWGLDLLLAISMLTIIQVSSFLFLGLDLAEFETMAIAEYAITVLPLFAVFYLFYFSFSLRAFGKTIGMSLLEIKLEAEGGKRLTFGQTILRSILSLVSLLFLGIPSMLKLVDKLSQTKLVSA